MTGAATSEAKVSIIIVSYNTCELLDACVASIHAHTLSTPFEIIVVDNHSSDRSVEMLKSRWPAVRLIENHDNPGFGGANNQGVALSRAPYVMLLNSDTLLLEDTVGALVAFLERTPQAATVGPRVLLMDGTRQPKTFGLLPSARTIFNQSFLLCRLFPRVPALAGIFVEHATTREMRVGWISGVCMMIRRDVYTDVGGFDADFFLYAEDIDLCRRFSVASWDVYRVDDYAIKHLRGASTKSKAVLMRNHVLQQRNYLRLIDCSTGPFGRAVARASLGAGLLGRMVLRGLSGLLLRPDDRLLFHVSMKCLADLLGLTGQLPGVPHARRD